MSVFNNAYFQQKKIDKKEIMRRENQSESKEERDYLFSFQRFP